MTVTLGTCTELV